MTTDVPTINCLFQNESSLYLAYMPFIKGGGLFIRTKTTFPFGSSVNLQVQLMDDPETIFITGQVVWITPKGAQGNKPMGVGVQFIGDTGRPLCNKIETYLAGMLKSSQITDTI